MTTVCYKNNQMAADGLVVEDSLIVAEHFNKIVKLEFQYDGTLTKFVMGFAGDPCCFQKILNHVLKTRGSIDFSGLEVKDESIQLLMWVCVDGVSRLYYMDSILIPLEIRKDTPHAIGSGKEIALAILNLDDKDVRDAVAMAKRLDVFTGGEILVVDLK